MLTFSLNSCGFFNKKSDALSPKVSSEFIKGSLDIPVAKGLEIISDEDVEFDSSSGSFTSSTYQSKNMIPSSSMEAFRGKPRQATTDREG